MELYEEIDFKIADQKWAKNAGFQVQNCPLCDGKGKYINPYGLIFQCRGCHGAGYARVKEGDYVALT